MAVSKDVSRVAVAGLVLVGVGIGVGSKNGPALVEAFTSPYSAAISGATSAAGATTKS
jgi:hypothetical protein